MNPKKLAIVLSALSLILVLAAQAFSQSQTIYNNIPNPLPGNLVSVAYEATGTSEFGDRVTFAAGTNRGLKTVVQTMSSWGCQSGHWYSGDCVTTPGATFSLPITLNIYNVGPGNAPGSLIGSVTQTFAIPYRPSADLINCTGNLAGAYPNPGDTGKWYDASTQTCFNGYATDITFNLGNLTVPDSVIFGIAYNTSHYGYAPIGELAACYASSGGCGYDSLNVAVSDPASSLSVGSNPAPNDAYQFTIYDSCTNGAIMPFGLDAGCWTGYKPATRFGAAFLTKDQCQKGVEQQEKDFNAAQKAADKAFDDGQKAAKKAFYATHPTAAQKKAFDDLQDAQEKAFDDAQKAAKDAFEDQYKADEKRCDQLPKGDKDDKDDKKDKDDKGHKDGH
jgi:hypothetical protein